MGVGFILVVSPDEKEEIMTAVSKHYACYEIGSVRKGCGRVELTGRLRWL